MTAQNISIQPRQKPAKAKTQAEKQAEAAMREIKLKQEAQQEAAAVEYLGGEFPEPAEAIKNAAPKQQQDLLRSANAIADQVSPNAPPPPAAPVQHMAEPAISNVDAAAGIPSNQMPDQVTDPRAASQQSQGGIIPAVPRPPQTRDQYMQQQRGETTKFPDIIDIITGNAPGETMINTPKIPTAPVAPPPVVQHVTITHEAPAKELAYRLTRKFAGFLGVDGGWVEYAAGTVLYETWQIEQLLGSGFDGLQPEEVAKDFVTCPACQHQFPQEAGR